MGTADGNGWVACRCGSRHWGLHGAAGLLLHRDAPGVTRPGQVLLQLRAPWVHHGGTWAAPGGAIDSHESPIEGALREAEEEAGIGVHQVRVRAVLLSADHGDWRYHLVLGSPVGLVRPAASNHEASAVRWVPVAQVADLDLHPGFAAAWPAVADAVRGLSPPRAAGSG